MTLNPKLVMNMGKNSIFYDCVFLQSLRSQKNLFKKAFWSTELQSRYVGQRYTLAVFKTPCTPSEIIGISLSSTVIFHLIPTGLNSGLPPFKCRH